MIGDSVGIIMIQLPPHRRTTSSYDNLNLLATHYGTVRYDTTIPPAWIFHRHCVYYSPLGLQCKMEYPGAPAAGFPEEMRRGMGGRWRGMRSEVHYQFTSSPTSILYIMIQQICFDSVTIVIFFLLCQSDCCIINILM